MAAPTSTTQPSIDESNTSDHQDPVVTPKTLHTQTSVDEKETEVILSPTVDDTNDLNDSDKNDFPFPLLRRQKTSNVNVLNFDNLMTMLSTEISGSFNQKVADHLIATIREDEFDLDDIRDDIDQIDDSTLIQSVADKFNWQLTEQQRFRNTIQNVINPTVGDLTGMKSIVCRKNIASELLVCGFLRNVEAEVEEIAQETSGNLSDSETSEHSNHLDELSLSINLPGLVPDLSRQRSLGMIVVPDGVMNLVVQYYQTITVYGVGRNSRGEFGVGKRNNFFHLQEIAWCSSNSDFTLSSIIPCTINGIAYVSSDGSLWVAGYNKYAQFGLSHCEDVVDIAVQHPFYRRNQLSVRDVSHGKKAYHMFVTCTNGTVWCHGANEWGQCGIGRERDTEQDPILIDTNTWAPPLEEKVMISDISCGIEFSLFLTTTHTVYSCGRNKWGQLGFPNTGTNPVSFRVSLRPRLIEELANNRKVNTIRCADCSSYCIDSDGKLLSWGRNEFGQLGTGERNMRLRWKPKVVSYFDDRSIQILKICSGSDFVLVLDASGQVYSWGFGKYGTCGDGDIKHRYEPHVIKALERFNIVDISCGATHSLAVSDKRSIWSWGYNLQNQCCIDTFNPQRLVTTCREVKWPRIVNTAVTKIVSNMENVIGVRTSTNSTLFIVDDGKSRK